MSKKAFKSQASASRAFSGNALTGSAFGFGSGTSSTFASGPSSVLSYVYEPPDLSLISDPAVSVSFKNLQKKDSTTKFKALEDLNVHVTAQAENKQGLEEVFLEAWTKLFPRTAIDNSNRVRQLVLALHGKIVSLCGKSYVKHMPATVGAWLAGGYDRDRQVSRTARESLQAAFTTEAKQIGVSKAFQESILDYCLNAIQKETVQTLSDERTSSPDDAQAKYSRAVGGALQTIAGLLDTLNSEGIHKHSQSYQDCLQSDAVWKLAGSDDSGLRRAVYRLGTSAVQHALDLVDVAKLGNVLIKQMSADQNGSAYEFVHVLSIVTKEEPQVWSSLYSGKKSAISRINAFFAKGSSGVGAEFYKQLSSLISYIPIELFTEDLVSSEQTPSKSLTSLRDGITGNATGKRDSELHPNDAWLTFLKLSDGILTSSEDVDKKHAVIKDALISIVQHFVEPSLVDWGRNWPDNLDMIKHALLIAWKHGPDFTTSELESTSKALIEGMQASLPEQSKDFRRSQDAIIARFKKWYDLQTVALADNVVLTDVFSTTASAETIASIELLKARNGKPYSAAIVLELLATRLPQTSLKQSETIEKLKAFAQDFVPKFMQSPSAPALLAFLRAVGSELDTISILDTCVSELLTSPASSTRSAALQSLATSHWPTDSSSSQRLTQAVLEDLDQAIQGDESTWSLPLAVLDSAKVPENLDDQILSRMLRGLSVESEIEPSLQGLNQLARRNNKALREFAKSSPGTGLLSRLFYLSHQEDSQSRRSAAILRDAIGTMTSNEKNTPIVQILKSNILSASVEALPVSALLSQAETLLADLSTEEQSKIVIELIPNAEEWQKCLAPFLERSIDPALSMIDSLGGAVFLMLSSIPVTKPEDLDYESRGLSPPLRAAVFLLELFRSRPDLELDSNKLADTQIYIALVHVLLGDDLSLPQQSPLFKSVLDEKESDMTEIQTDLGRLVASQAARLSITDGSESLYAYQRLIEQSKGLSSSAYYYARASVLLSQWIEDSHKLPTQFVADQNTFAQLRKTPDLFIDLVLLSQTSDITAAVKLFNELIADISAATSSQPDSLLRQVVILNQVLRLLADNGVELEDIPKQRLVYFVKACITLLEDHPVEGLQTELLKALGQVLPPLASIYDEFWESMILQAISAVESPTSSLATVRAGLQLYTILQRTLTNEDVNDDLQEAWGKLQNDIGRSRVTWLQRQAKAPSQSSQPLRIVQELLSRQISTSGSKTSVSADQIYPVLGSRSTTIQKAAYQILEPSIQSAQEQVSLDAALSKDYIARLPQELLSALLDAPEADEYLDLRALGELPWDLSRYLLSWKLILAHWHNASYKVRASYVAELKEGPYVDGFLLLCFKTLLEHHQGKGKAGYDTSKLPSISSYEINNAEDPQIEFFWLLCNIYYLLLLHAPHLVKSWHTNSCPRALKSLVETWTAKHFSPSIITQELATVSEWKPTAEDANSELTLKISPKASEVTASLPLDETSIAIKIHLPPSYPLSPIGLTTSQRVGIDEKKWQSFLNVSRIVMNFSSTSQGLGAVIDGIAAWRNNVLAALKGHIECAICYSVVAEDGKVPSKKCATCGHLFHGLCLYKWFQRSAGSSCPLCRNAFNYA